MFFNSTLYDQLLLPLRILYLKLNVYNICKMESNLSATSKNRRPSEYKLWLKDVRIEIPETTLRSWRVNKITLLIVTDNHDSLTDNH